MIPVLIWGAFAFGRHNATAAIVALSGLAIGGAVSETGPFVKNGITQNESLLLLQGFMGTIAHTMLVLSAVVAQRRRATEHLEEQVAERTVAARESEERAVEANLAKSQFLASMSHELRTPLNAIIGYTELMRDRAGDVGAVDFGSDLHNVETAAKHLLTLINEILDLSKIEAGKLALTLEVVDLVELASVVEATMRPMAARNGNALETVVEAGGGGLTVVADPTRLKQVLLNLLSNACKFTAKGKVSLRVFREGPDVVLRVSDTGIGLTPEQLGRLFIPFTQADATIARRYGGTGIGLAICKRLVELMKGEIAVASESGKGTVVTVRLPGGVAP
ncbi:MAG TPA: ATP-binding protein [Thermoanaerobaculia bacterium]|nr:ATP-binding protein [Thermoanaerobaculia bacterium]